MQKWGEKERERGLKLAEYDWTKLVRVVDVFRVRLRPERGAPAGWRATMNGTVFVFVSKHSRRRRGANDLWTEGGVGGERLIDI